MPLFVQVSQRVIGATDATIRDISGHNECMEYIRSLGKPLGYTTIDQLLFGDPFEKPPGLTKL